MKLYLDINTHPLVGGSLNTLVLITAHRKSRYRAGGGDLARTNIHFLVFHLTLADTIVSMGEISIRAYLRIFANQTASLFADLRFHQLYYL